MKTKKVLVIDDDYDIVEPLSMLLSDSGYEVRTITKGYEVYEKIEKFKPDVILLDVLMSGSDGRTICKTIKEHKDMKTIQIIMMSAYPNAKKESTQVGADAFIAKPFETSNLLTLIQKILQKTIR